MVNKVLIISVALLIAVFHLEARQSDSSIFFSGRAEVIQYNSFTGRIREEEPEESKLYLNNVYLNLEGSITNNLDFIIEYQAKTDNLYSLGGFVTIADSLEGIAGDDDEEEDEPLNARQLQVSQLASFHLNAVTSSKEDIKFERLNLDYGWGRKSGVRLGNIRVPFGLWDDYSLFRNLSAGKTDPITLGVQLRRTDIGALLYGEFQGTNLSYDVALVNGESTFDVSDSDNEKDFIMRLNFKKPKLDIGFNTYLRSVTDFDTSYSAGVYFRYKPSSTFTLLGEIPRNLATSLLTLSGA